MPRAALTALVLAVVLVGQRAPQAQPAAAEMLFRDITKAIGITFTHHAAPEKKYIVESMSGGVALFDFDNDGRLDIYFVNSLTVDTAGDPKSARSALYRNLGDNKFEDVTDTRRRRPSGLGHGRVHGRRRRRRLGGPVRHRPRRQQALSQQRRQGVHRRHRGGGGGGRRLVGGLRLRRLRSRRRPRSLRQPLRQDRPEEPAPVRQGQDLRVPRHRRAVRAARAARRVRLPLPQRGQRHVSRTSARKPAFPIRRSTSGSASPGSTSTRTAGRISTSPTIRRRTSSTSIRRTARSRSRRFPMGVAVSEDGAEQGSMGVAVGDYDLSGRFSLWVTNFSEEYNALYHNDGSHFTDASFRSRDGGGQPAVRRLGQRVLRLRQRFAARPDRRQRPRVSAARQGAAAGVGGLPAAQAALPQSRQRHVRGGRAALRSDDQR